jgi:hypothetical protein
MFSSTREEIQEDFDALRAAVSRILGHSYEALTTPERLTLLERLEQETRRLPVPGHQLINQLAEQAPPEEPGGKPTTIAAAQSMFSDRSTERVHATCTTIADVTHVTAAFAVRRNRPSVCHEVTFASSHPHGSGD